MNDLSPNTQYTPSPFFASVMTVRVRSGCPSITQCLGKRPSFVITVPCDMGNYWRAGIFRACPAMDARGCILFSHMRRLASFFLSSSFSSYCLMYTSACFLLLLYFDFFYRSPLWSLHPRECVPPSRTSGRWLQVNRGRVFIALNR